MHPRFELLCDIHRKYIAFSRRGIWTNNLRGHGAACRRTFNPRCSNFNLHLNRVAAAEFARDWPEAVPYVKGVEQDSTHPPPYVAIKDVVSDEERMWQTITTCDINRYWSAMIGVFRGELRGWFCEIAGAQSMLHQHEPEYPDTGCAIQLGWWKQGYDVFGRQILRHCPDCGVPLRGTGTLGIHGDKEQVSATHESIYRPKRSDRPVELVTDIEMLGGQVRCATDYMERYSQQRNSLKPTGK